jgi:hypothetical protein
VGLETILPLHIRLPSGNFDVADEGPRFVKPSFFACIRVDARRLFQGKPSAKPIQICSNAMSDASALSPRNLPGLGMAPTSARHFRPQACPPPSFSENDQDPVHAA